MKLLSYTVDMRFSNAPSVRAQIAIVDADGKDQVTDLAFVDDEARALVEMVPNPAPGGTGLVATGEIVVADLIAAITARVSEAAGTPSATADRVAAAEVARAALRETNAAAEAKLAEIAVLDARIAAKEALLGARV